MLRRISVLLRNGPAILAAGVFVGLFVPPVADLCRPLLPVMVFIFVFGTFLRVDVATFQSTLVRPKLSIGFPLITMLALPFTIWLVLSPFDVPRELLFAVILTAASPSSSGNAAVSRMLGYEGELPITIIVVTMCIAPITLPIVISALFGVNLNSFQLFNSLFLFLSGTIICSLVLRVFSPVLIVKNSNHIDRLILISLFVFSVGTMSGVQAQLFENPYKGLLYIISAFALNLSMQVVGFMFASEDMETKLAASITLGNRNVGIIWAVFGSIITPDVALFLAVFQLPIFILPWIISKVRFYVIESRI